MTRRAAAEGYVDFITARIDPGLRREVVGAVSTRVSSTSPNMFRAPQMEVMPKQRSIGRAAERRAGQHGDGAGIDIGAEVPFSIPR